MPKKLICLLLLSIINFGLLYADNKSRQVYGVYTEVFPGVKWLSDASVSPSDPDVGNLDPTWIGGSATNMNIPAGSLNSDSVDGSQYIRIVSNSGAYYFYFRNNPQDMSAFANGEIEFWIRSNASTPANAADLIKIGYQSSGGDKILTLTQIAALGGGVSPLPLDGKWHKYAIPMVNTSFNVTPAAMLVSLQTVLNPFLMRTTANVSFDFDRMLWKKNSASFAPVIKNRSNNVAASVITWDNTGVGQSNQIAQQYIYIPTDYNPAPDGQKINWGLQIYTDNTVANGNIPAYTGSISTDTKSGLVCVESPSSEMIPIIWRASTAILAASDFPTVTTWWSPWFDLKDKASFSKAAGSNVYDGSDYIRVMDNKRGIQWDSGQFGFSKSNEVWIYFIADFSSRYVHGGYTYKTMITIELFNE